MDGSPGALWSLSYPEIGWAERDPKGNDRWIRLHAGGIRERIELRLLGDEDQGFEYQKYNRGHCP
jgi:hypothetical protein